MHRFQRSCLVTFLRREISLKVIREKSSFQAAIFGIILVTMNRHTYKLFKNIFNDVQTEGIGELNTA